MLANATAGVALSVLLVLGGILGGARPTAAPPSAPATAAHASAHADSAVEAYLTAFRAAYVRATIRGRADSVLDYYADDVRLMPEFQKTVMSKGNAAAYHRAFAGRFAVRAYTRSRTEVLDLGARVVEHGLFAMRLTVNGTSREHELLGKYQDVWARGPGGRLSLVTQAWNYSHPTELEARLRFDAVPGVDVAFQPRVPIRDAISLELAALNRLAEATIAQHDARIWAQFYADDAALRYSRHPVYAGRPAIAAFLAAHVRELPVFEKLDIRTDRIDDLGRYVFEYASHIAVVRSGEWSGVSTGKNTVIWRREPGGALKVFRGMAMYD